MKKVKCVECGYEVKYKVVKENYVYEEDGMEIEYEGKKAICSKCKSELLIDEIEDYNQEQFEKAYKKMNEIITIEEINEILEKYNIGKRALSIVLGFGEITITRYLDGYIPTPKNSKYLKKILKSPEEYYAMLMKNGKNISPLSFKKSKERCEEILDIDSNDNTIIDISNYIVNKYDETTPLALQKILYYIQMFGLAFIGKPIFNNQCKRWAHGPVYSEVYFEFKNNGCNPIDEVCESSELYIDDESKKVIDEVLKAFACYSGNALAYFTHSEDPWINARDQELEVIPRESIIEQGNKIKKQYKIKNIEDISLYSADMFDKYKKMLSKGA